MSKFRTRSRILGIMTMIIALLIALIPESIFAAGNIATAPDEQEDFGIGMQYTISGPSADDLTLTITRKKGDGMIPDYGGYPGSTQSGAPWAEKASTTVKKLSISEGVTFIGANAFYNCTALSGDIVIPASVTHIGNNAFTGLPDVNAIVFAGDAPASVTANNTKTSSLKSFDDSITIYYRDGAKGFTTPGWYGYHCYPLSARNKAVVTDQREDKSAGEQITAEFPEDYDATGLALTVNNSDGAALKELVQERSYQKVVAAYEIDLVDRTGDAAPVKGDFPYCEITLPIPADLELKEGDTLQIIAVGESGGTQFLEGLNSEIIPATEEGGTRYIRFQTTHFSQFGLLHTEKVDPTSFTWGYADRRTDCNNTAGTTATVSTTPTSDRYLFINTSDGNSIRTALQADGRRYDSVSYFSLSMTDQPDGSGNAVTDFGTCTIKMALANGMSRDTGNVELVTTNDSGQLVSVGGTGYSKTEGVSFVTFPAERMREYALVYTRQEQSTPTLTVLDRRTASPPGQANASIPGLSRSGFLIINSTAGNIIRPLIAADTSISTPQEMVVYDITLMDAREGGSPITSFGTCMVELPLPTSMDASRGSVWVYTMKDGKLDKSVASVTDKVNNVSLVRFYTTHFTEYALLYYGLGSQNAAASASASAAGQNASGTAASAASAATAASGAAASASAAASAASSAAAAQTASSATVTNASSTATTAFPIVYNIGKGDGTDMPKTGDIRSYRMLIASMLFFAGVVEFLISIPKKRVR